MCSCHFRLTYEALRNRSTNKASILKGCPVLGGGDHQVHPDDTPAPAALLQPCWGEDGPARSHGLTTALSSTSQLTGRANLRRAKTAKRKRGLHKRRNAFPHRPSDHLPLHNARASGISPPAAPTDLLRSRGCRQQREALGPELQSRCSPNAPPMTREEPDSSLKGHSKPRPELSPSPRAGRPCSAESQTATATKRRLSPSNAANPPRGPRPGSAGPGAARGPMWGDAGGRNRFCSLPGKPGPSVPSRSGCRQDRQVQRPEVTASGRGELCTPGPRGPARQEVSWDDDRVPEAQLSPAPTRPPPGGSSSGRRRGATHKGVLKPGAAAPVQAR